MEQQWLNMSKRLQAIASTGSHFTKDVHDRDRFAEVASIANQMLALLGQVPLERIMDLIPDFAIGYSTPKVDVRGAVVKNDTVLLVRERSDGLWTLPGGFADVGISAARNVEKEIVEEAGLTVTATRLYGLRHKARHPYDPDVRDFYKLFFLCDPVDAGTPFPGDETLDVGFFGLDALPPLSRSRIIEADIEAAIAYGRDPTLPTFFD